MTKANATTTDAGEIDENEVATFGSITPLLCRFMHNHGANDPRLAEIVADARTLIARAEEMVTDHDGKSPADERAEMRNDLLNEIDKLRERVVSGHLDKIMWVADGPMTCNNVVMNVRTPEQAHQMIGAMFGLLINASEKNGNQGDDPLSRLLAAMGGD